MSGKKYVLIFSVLFFVPLIVTAQPESTAVLPALEQLQNNAQPQAPTGALPALEQEQNFTQPQPPIPGDQVKTTQQIAPPAQANQNQPQQDIQKLIEAEENKPAEIPMPEQKDDPADIYLNFEKASLGKVVAYVTEQRNLNVLPPINKNEKDSFESAPVSLSTRQPMTLAQTWKILLTLLDMNNFAIVKVENVYRIVGKDAKTSTNPPLPFYASSKGVEPKDLPDDDSLIRYAYSVKNLTVNMAAELLKDFLGEDKLKSYDKFATIMITDKSYNIRSAMQIIEELDNGGLRESITILPLSYSSADEIKKMIDGNDGFRGKEDTDDKQPMRIFGPQQKKEFAYFSSSTKIIKAERQNALIFLGAQDHINTMTTFIKKYLDIPSVGVESRLHIKELKYFKADELQSLITPLLSPEALKGDGKSPIFGEYKFFEDVDTAAEEPPSADEKKKFNGGGNRLIVACNKDDWRRLNDLIDRLDKPQPQVALEIIVVDVTGDFSKKLGAQIRMKTGKEIGAGVNVFTSNISNVNYSTNKDVNLLNQAGLAGGDRGSSELTLGKDGDIWAVFKSFISNSQTNIISQPFMITKNGEECRLEITTKKNVPGKFSDDRNRTKQDFPLKPATNLIIITPHLNAFGTIDLDINIQLKEFIATTDPIANSDYPETSDRTINTRTALGAGEVLVLGGLTKNSVDQGTYKTPILGDIPVVGNLFKYKTKQKGTSNLYVFIRPSIIKPRFEGGPDEYTQLKLDYAKYQVLNSEELHKTSDPIQRWFFHTEKEPLKQTISKLRNGIYRPIDDYSEGREQPNLVNIKKDPYFRVTEAITAQKEKETETKKKREQYAKQLKEKMQQPAPATQALAKNEFKEPGKSKRSKYLS